MAVKKTKRYKFDKYQYLCRSFEERTRRLFGNDSEKRPTNKEICKLTGASPTSVAKWFSGNQLPSLEQIYKLSQYFEVSIDWLIKNNLYSPSDDFSENTYFDVFRHLISLYQWKIIDVSQIYDPFLDYLMREYVRLSTLSNLPHAKLEEWLKKVEKDYTFRLFFPNLIDTCYPLASESFIEVTEYDTYLARIKALDEFRNYTFEVGISDPDDLSSEWLNWVQEHTDSEWERPETWKEDQPSWDGRKHSDS